MFEELGLLGNAIVLLLSFLVLSKASDVVVEYAEKLAFVTGISATTIGFLLISFSTSLPEFSIALSVLITGEGIGLPFGNVLGANITNITLILGICYLVLFLKKGNSNSINQIQKEEINSLNFGLFIASTIPLALLYLGEASKFIGIILVFVFILSSFQISVSEKEKSEKASKEERKKIKKYALLIFIGIIGVLMCGALIVDSATYIALELGVPEVIIGATIVAFGTTVPELSVNISAVRKGKIGIMLGNVIGSCFINITCILGLALIALPFAVSLSAFTNLVLFSIIAKLFLWYFLSGLKMTWKEGIIFLFLYGLFLATSFSSY
ncbi:MAG: sodium:calcium antiporter [Nitrososphaeria archaeon]